MASRSRFAATGSDQPDGPALDFTEPVRGWPFIEDVGQTSQPGGVQPASVTARPSRSLSRLTTGPPAAPTTRTPPCTTPEVGMRYQQPHPLSEPPPRPRPYRLSPGPPCAYRPPPSGYLTPPAYAPHPPMSWQYAGGRAALEPFRGPAQRPAVIDDTAGQPQPAGLGQRGITVDHEGRHGSGAAVW